MDTDWSADLAVAPAAARLLLASRVNVRGRRAFGVLKTESEFVGVVDDAGFEVWERQTRAIHAYGTFTARSRGTRATARFAMPLRTRVLLLLFAVLYLLAAAGIATQPPDPSISPGEALIAAGGAVLVGTLFAGSARRQRADLRAFLDRAFSGAPRI